MTNFNITADNFAWITGAADDPEDKCLHGHVTVTIGGKTFEANGTVSATALYLLKSLTEDHIPADHDLQMVPCCGHFYIASEDLMTVTILGCDTGLDWTIRHDGRTVLLTAPDGTEESVPYSDYLYKVCRFADKVERYYDQCSPKVIRDDEFDRNGYTAFWNEWYRRYNEAELTESIATGREIELHCRDKHYFLSRHSDTEWYFWCEETNEKQMFASGEELYRTAKIDGKLLCEELTNIRIDAIL